MARPAQGIRSMAEIGDLWPRCGNCHHIAQSHPNCDELVIRQCPTCNQHNAQISCGCVEYVGPTREEFAAKYLNEAERNYYGSAFKTE